MAKKKSSASRSRRGHRSSALTDATTSQAPGENIAEVAQQGGVTEQNITLTTGVVRTVSDSQAGEGTPPPVPTPAPIDSPTEMNVATTGDAVVAEANRWRRRTRAAINAGRASTLHAHQNDLWAMEWDLLRGKPPRISFVGRSIHVNTQRPGCVADYITIFETINHENRDLLPDSLQRAIDVIRNGPSGQTTAEQRDEITAATSALSKNLKHRVGWLIGRLRYALRQKEGRTAHYRLTRLGSRVFNGWPPWNAPDAIRGEIADETDAEETDAGPAPTTD